MLAKALENWQSWGLAEPHLIKQFNNGLNHHAGLIQSDNKLYVLKVFEHSAQQAIQAQQWAAQLDIAPAIHFFDDSTLIMDYVESTDTNNDDKHLTLANTLSRLHSASVQQTEPFDLLNFCQLYLASADNELQKKHDRLLPILNTFINDATPWCFCHNDLVVDNCLFYSRSYQTATLIDWEYAQYHNPWFDLAAIVYYFKLSEQQAADFLEHYQAGWSTHQNKPIFYASQISLLWGDVLWHAAKFGSAYKPQLQKKLSDIEKLLLGFNLSS